MIKKTDKAFLLVLSLPLFFTAPIIAGINGPIYKVHGASWVESGRIIASHDTLTNDGQPNSIDYNGSQLEAFAVQFTVDVNFDKNFDGEIGFGTYKATHSFGSYNGSTGYKFFAISLFQNYLTQAKITYHLGDKESPWLSFTAGNFSYRYNSDTKNLGSYLLRGPIYTPALISGFQDPSIDSSRSNIFGFKIHHLAGNFSHDLIFKNEMDAPPTFDWSLAYLAKYRFSDIAEIGAGINLYRLIPYDSKLETPGHLSGDSKHSYEIIDTITNDTLFFSHQGIKVAGTASLALNKLLNIQSLGENDLKVYTEAAIIGIKNYGTTYAKISDRIPIMVGFNLPAFKWLDFLSVEFEYYGSKYRNDLANTGNINGVADWTVQTRPTPSPAPVAGVYSDSTRDDIKWSLNLQKTVKQHIQFICQIADDHYRPRPIANGFISATGGTAEALTTPRDWYLMARIGYFF